ncbi:MAG: hypothetical protein A3F40_00710 [Chlamydiae bacterium RIFCSPHIGHO2_12_FULL_27_8]|nr:MAG: hypothetical protein A3F40_00710 [Chlamydiae bacterium RIFCSPHIGHO2_12_FULL_27_8]
MEFDPNLAFQNLIQNFFLNFFQPPSVFQKTEEEVNNQKFIDKTSLSIIYKAFRELNNDKISKIFNNFENLDFKMILQDKDFLKYLVDTKVFKNIFKNDELKIYSNVSQIDKNFLFSENKKFFNEAVKIIVEYLKYKTVETASNLKENKGYNLSKEHIQINQNQLPITKKEIAEQGNSIKTEVDQNISLKTFFNESNSKFLTPHGIVSFHNKDSSEKNKKVKNEKNKKDLEKEHDELFYDEDDLEKNNK